MAFEAIMINLQSTVNTAVLSNYSEVSVSAVGATATVISVLSLLGSAVATGAITTISNRIGAEKLTEAKELSFTAILTNVIIGAIMSPVMVTLTPLVVSMLNLTGEIYKEAVIYLQIRMAFLIFTYVTTAVLALLKCYGYAKYTFVVGFSTNALNLIFNVIVVYFPKYSPVTGVAGVAEANGALANYSAEIQILEGNCKTFIESVNMLDNENLSLAELRALIIIADGVKAGAEPTYDGVEKALKKLADAKAEYKATVEAINSAFSNEISKVSAVAGASVNQTRYYSANELIKLIVASFK